MEMEASQRATVVPQINEIEMEASQKRINVPMSAIEYNLLYENVMD